jgi:hypothetical protein
VSKGAVSNPDRRRELREVPIALGDLIEHGSKAYRLGACMIIVSEQAPGWHMSISRRDRLPSWEEVRDARYALIPDEVLMAMLLPPKADYVNVHPFCFQLYQVDSSYLGVKDVPRLD